MHRLVLAILYISVPAYVAAQCTSGTPTSGLYGTAQGAVALRNMWSICRSRRLATTAT